MIVIVVVGLLGAVGWLVYDRQNDKTASTIQTEQFLTTQNTTANPQTRSNDYLTLADYKVRIPLNDKTSGLKLGSVSASSYNDADKTVPIIAPELDSDWKCKADPSGNFKGTIGMISITTRTKRSGPYEPLVMKKVGNYTWL